MSAEESDQYLNVGTRLIRRDAAERLTGHTAYTEDIRLPGMLYGVLVQSPVAAGRLRRIDVDRAAALDGVVKVLTAEDVTDRRYGNYVKDQPIFARDRVRFVGEPVALVAATSLAVARRAAGLVEVDIEATTPVVDLREALTSTEVLVHDRDTNVIEDVHISRGDVDAVFHTAHAVVHTEIESHRAHQAYLEPRAVTAAPAPGGFSLIMSTQQPFGVRAQLAELFDLPTGAIEVRVPAIGGGFGGKLHLLFAPQATAMTLATGRPVQIVCSRAEDMATGNPRENSIVRMSSAVDESGRILARRCDVVLDAGAYAMDTPVLTSMAAFYATGPYRIDTLDIRGRAVYTNTCPTGSFRGPSGPQMVYAAEAQIEDIAQQLGLDPAEVRRRNFIGEGDRGPTGELITLRGTTEECMRVVESRLQRWRQADVAPGDHRRRGYGLACAWWSTLGTPSAAAVELHEDGTATLSSGGTEIGTGAISTALPSMVAEELGLRLDRVILKSGGTRDSPYDSGSRGSRTMFATGNATVLAARAVAEQIRNEASRLLEVDPADLVLREGRVEVKGAPETGMTIAEVSASAHLHSGPVVATGRYRAELAPVEGSDLQGARFLRLGEPTFHCHGVEIALDEETGRVDVLNFVAVHDVGRVVNPVGARGQVEGGVVQGIGYALTENLRTNDAGVIVNGNLHDYRLPTIADVPPNIETVFIETNHSHTGPFGAKGLGEPPVILPAAAIGSALRDLLGVQPYHLPLDADRVVLTMAERGSRPAPGSPPSTARPPKPEVGG
ncbi:xanthine dehydrogenase family protein molybdopterin-binding subunit [Streptomyces sp. NBC_00582]|uniref:xanthine dehydrogenase family protein molybdopterin-binding subunit n=1 Tax=Streptomyces sp. NBC_00582 TaxID=2975783 RepID=UPI002E80A795|nr:xanthine dehydrogenase family protein molybdopterin-binding subunit [Streptomyces sp. NBC_00582]WUB61691.1 xanthine dehydrogenase family protein molybdopterin-binding subunit [Streptomyces sp. NBC_00582]